MLDRNGLRPARYYVTKDDRVVLSSEAGAVPVAQEQIAYKGRLEPGRLFLVNTAEQRIIEDDEIKHMLATSHPYGEWCREHIIEMDELVEERGSMINDTLIPFDLKEQQKVFGYTQEDLTQMIVPMARMGKDPVGAMGIDAPLPVLSERPQMLYRLFPAEFCPGDKPAHRRRPGKYRNLFPGDDRQRGQHYGTG